MGRRQEAHKQNKEHIKNRKEQKIQKSTGAFKKRTIHEILSGQGSQTARPVQIQDQDGQVPQRQIN